MHAGARSVRPSVRQLVRSFPLCAPPTLKASKQLWEKLCVRWVASGPSKVNLLAFLPSTGVNIGGAGSYIYEKPPAEAPQVTGPIEVPVVRTEERKTSGPPKGPSKGGGRLWVGVGYGWPRSALTQCHPLQPLVSPRSLGSPTCVLDATRECTSVSDAPAPDSRDVVPLGLGVTTTLLLPPS